MLTDLDGQSCHWWNKRCPLIGQHRKEARGSSATIDTTVITTLPIFFCRSNIREESSRIISSYCRQGAPLSLHRRIIACSQSYVQKMMKISFITRLVTAQHHIQGGGRTGIQFLLERVERHPRELNIGMDSRRYGEMQAYLETNLKTWSGERLPITGWQKRKSRFLLNCTYIDKPRRNSQPFLLFT